MSRGPDIHTPPELRSGRLCLRTPRDADAAAHLALGRDADIARMYGLDRAEAAAPLQEAETLARSFHFRWKQVPDPTHHSRKSAFSLLDTGFRHGPRDPRMSGITTAVDFANVRVLATWTFFESEF